MKKLFSVVVLHLLFCSFILAQTVYVTKSGKKYHTSNCSSLRSSSIEISLSEATQKGYTPCSRCNPAIYSEGSSNTTKKQMLDTSVPQNKSTNTTSTKNCIAITKKGTQCTRNALEGSDYCWQHDKTKTTIISETKSNTSNSSGRTIYTGPRGGKYYINKNGKKTYIKKKK